MCGPHVLRRLIAVALLPALAVLLIGCGSDSGSSPDGDSLSSGVEARKADASSLATSAIVFTDATSDSGLTWTYRNGEEAQHFAILESLGGGVGVLDVDSDGHPDAVIPGGGEFLTGEALTRGTPDGPFP